MTNVPSYPFVPKSNVQLAPGQFWSIPLSDGRFACGRVLGIDRTAAYGSKTSFVGGILDWVGDRLPTSDAIAGRAVVDVGHLHVRAIAEDGGAILGERPLEADRIVVPKEVRSHWFVRYAISRAEWRFIDGAPPPPFERREVRSPLTDVMLRPPTTGAGVIQFNSLLTDPDFERLGAWIRDYPRMSLRAYASYDASIQNLEFLRFFPFLRSFSVDALVHALPSLDGLRHLPADLDSLAIGSTSRILDLSIIARFRELTALSLDGQMRNLGVISGLTSIEDLTLRSITLPDLSSLLPLRQLRSLDIKLGGTRDLRLLPRLAELRYLELWLVKGLADISMVGNMLELRSLFLQALRQVQALPDMSQARNLRRIHLQTMKGIRDLGPLTTAPALEGLVLEDMDHLQPDAVLPLIGIPHLKAVGLGLGSLRKNDRAQALLGLPTAPPKPDWRTIP